MKFGIVIIFFLFTALSNQALAKSAMAKPFSVKCKFTSGQVTTFDKGTPATSRNNDMPDLIFDQIDVKKQTARMIGNVGAETIKVLLGDDSVHLLEYTKSGNINVTTIFYIQNTIKNSDFPVVHSRHMNAQGAFPQQYLGLCVKLS